MWVGRGGAQPARSVNVVPAYEEDGRDEARLEETHLHSLLGQLEEHHRRSPCDAREHFWRGGLRAIELCGGAGRDGARE